MKYQEIKESKGTYISPTFFEVAIGGPFIGF